MTMQERSKRTIRELTGRNVTAFLPQAHVEPDITVEMFFVDGPLRGFGAVEITGPELLNADGVRRGPPRLTPGSRGWPRWGRPWPRGPGAWPAARRAGMS